MSQLNKNHIEQVPQICFGQVLHARLRPVANKFSYGVFFIRLPLRNLATGNFATKFMSRNRFNALSFFDSDHGDGKQTLVEWIDALLQAEGIEDADGEVILQTFPRVLGYVFNPVSFWFCHNKDGQLRAVLCDVRNTFGERHYYLLENGSTQEYGIELFAKKVFHVSPFCRIEGKYRFRFMLKNASNESETSLARIDHDDATGLLLSTSISGTHCAISDGAVIRAFFCYPLMTFGIMAKIHWQALRLWIKRVSFYSKPTPPQEKVTR